MTTRDDIRIQVLEEFAEAQKAGPEPPIGQVPFWATKAGIKRAIKKASRKRRPPRYVRWLSDDGVNFYNGVWWSSFRQITGRPE